MAKQNVKVIFVKRPGTTASPTYDCFASQVEEFDESSVHLKQGEVLLQTLYLSVDPATRCCMNESTGVEYLRPWAPGSVAYGLGATAKVLRSADDRLAAGDTVGVVVGYPWQTFVVTAADKCHKVNDLLLPGHDSSVVLSALGLTGLTALLGVRERAKGLTAGAGQVAVVSGAAGATGSLAGQIFKLLGAHKVVGIAGGTQKCQFLLDQFHFDGAIDYKNQDVAAELKKHCPNGINFYFDNVGGALSDTVISQMLPNSSVILCGQISQYNKDVPYPPPIDEKTAAAVKERNICRDRFLVLNYQQFFEDGIKQLAQWLLSGQLKVHHHVTEGIENTGKAFVDMMNGRNIGKAMVKV